MLLCTYGEVAHSERTCREWFLRFKSSHFDVEDRHSGRNEKIFEDSELEALLAEDWCQTHFETPQSHGNDSEVRKLGSVRVEVESC